jgi:hypothetical protein
MNKQDERVVLQAATKKLVGMIAQKKFSAILLAGRSAKCAGILIKSAWEAKYPQKPIPKFYSLANLGEPIRNTEDALDGTDHYYIDTKKAARILEKKMPSLKSIREPVLILDEYASTGDTLGKATEIVKEIGIKNVSCAVLIARPHILFPIGPGVIYGAAGEIPSFYGNRNFLLRIKEDRKRTDLLPFERRCMTSELRQLQDIRDRLHKFGKEVWGKPLNETTASHFSSPTATGAM